MIGSGLKLWVNPTCSTAKRTDGWQSELSQFQPWAHPSHHLPLKGIYCAQGILFINMPQRHPPLLRNCRYQIYKPWTISEFEDDSYLEVYANMKDRYRLLGLLPWQRVFLRVITKCLHCATLVHVFHCLSLVWYGIDHDDALAQPSCWLLTVSYEARSVITAGSCTSWSLCRPGCISPAPSCDRVAAYGISTPHNGHEYFKAIALDTL